MKLVHLSDLHIHDMPVGGTDPVEQFERVLKHVAKHHSDADAIVVTGDLTHEGKISSFEKLRDMLAAAAPLKLHLMLGNHDLRANFRTVFPDRPVDANGFIQHTADVAGHRLIMLDSVEPTSHAGRFGPERLTWLKEQLEEARRATLPVLLFMHHNPAPIGVWASDVLGLIDSDNFCAVLREYRNGIRHLFFGHTHYSLSGTLEGVPFSAPRSTNHPCWPEIGDRRRMGFGPIAPNYNVALISDRSVTVHTIDFMLEDKIAWLDIPNEHAWVHDALPQG